MKNLIIKFLAILLISMNSGSLIAQYTFFNPEVGFAIEVSLPNTHLKRLPIYRNSISSLIVIDDFIIGGTSAKEGLAPYIFIASLDKRKVINLQDLNEIIKGQRSLTSGFSRGKDNSIFAGTIANQNEDGSEGGGHLIQIDVGTEGEIKVEDLGVPIPGEGIFTLLGNSEGTMLYGITTPSGKFFQYDIQDKEVKIFNDISPKEKDLKKLNEYALKPENYLGKALIQDNEGLIYGSMPINKVFYFNPENQSFKILEDHLPVVWGRRVLGQVESWAKAEDGTLYGGNAGDGQLFKLDPITKEVTNLGKPIMMNRLRGLTFGKDGKLYGIAGALPGYSHLISYNPETGGYLDLGNPEFPMVAPGIEQGILWRGFQLETITSSEDGKYIIMGEDESLSQLLIFAVGQKNPGRRGF
jgi:hypothetical protein